MRLSYRTGSKVNLLLRVGPPGADGFHPLVSVFAALDLRDELEISFGGEGVSLQVEGAELGDPEQNLVYRVLRDAPGMLGVEPMGARARLVKRVPHQAGLGGGSADAAAALEAVWAASGGRICRDALVSFAAEFGSDVTFFLSGAYAIGRGRGTELEVVSSPARLAGIVVKPPVGSSTPEAYRALDAARPGQGALGEVEETEARNLAEALACPGTDPAAIAALMANDFHDVLVPGHAELEAVQGTLEETGSLRALLCGSGAALFGLYDGVDSRDRALAEVRARLPAADVHAVHTGVPGIAREETADA